MATSTLLNRLSVPALVGAKGPRLIELSPEGFPSLGLLHWFPFTETDFTAGTKDMVTGVMHQFEGLTIDANNYNTPASGGGGVVLKGWRNLVVPDIDSSKPWNFVAMTTMGLAPTAGQTAYSMLTVGVYPTNGLLAWQQSTTGFAADTPYGLFTHKRVNGTGGVTGPSQNQPYVTNFGKASLLSISHDGVDQFVSKRIDKDIMDVGAGIIDRVAMLDGAGPLLNTRVGGNGVTFGQNGATFDWVGFYDRVLGNDELFALNTYFRSLATARGRPQRA